jgi:hypothetical protein
VIFISEVQDAFVVTGEGLFIVPAIPQDDFRLRVKSPIQLRTPDGRILETHINAVEFLYAPEQISQDRPRPRLRRHIATPRRSLRIRRIWTGVAAEAEAVYLRAKCLLGPRALVMSSSDRTGHADPSERAPCCLLSSLLSPSEN